MTTFFILAKSINSEFSLSECLMKSRSRSRSFNHGLVLEGYGLDYITSFWRNDIRVWKRSTSVFYFISSYYFFLFQVFLYFKLFPCFFIFKFLFFISSFFFISSYFPVFLFSSFYFLFQVFFYFKLSPCSLFSGSFTVHTKPACYNSKHEETWAYICYPINLMKYDMITFLKIISVKPFKTFYLLFLC